MIGHAEPGADTATGLRRHVQQRPHVDEIMDRFDAATPDEIAGPLVVAVGVGDGNHAVVEHPVQLDVALMGRGDARQAAEPRSRMPKK